MALPDEPVRGGRADPWSERARRDDRRDDARGRRVDQFQRVGIVAVGDRLIALLLGHDLAAASRLETQDPVDLDRDGHLQPLGVLAGVVRPVDAKILLRAHGLRRECGRVSVSQLLRGLGQLRAVGRVVSRRHASAARMLRTAAGPIPLIWRSWWSLAARTASSVITPPAISRSRAGKSSGSGVVVSTGPGPASSVWVSSSDGAGAVTGPAFA